MTIHSEHPFRDPVSDPARRLRGRLGGVVTLWTSDGGPRGASGLTVSSVMVAAGSPPSVLALVDPDSDLFEALEETGRATVQLLSWHHRHLADVFADQAPAAGGKFAQAGFVATEWGPRLADVATWAGVARVEARPVGWSMLVTCSLEHVELGEDDEPLVHRRGRYLRPPP